MADRVGQGKMVSGRDEPAAGRFVTLMDVGDLLGVMDGDAGELVAYLEHPNVTMMAPIYDRLAAIVCASGDESAHVAIVARELGLPCAVQTSLTRDLAALEGCVVRLEPDGGLMLADEDAPAGA